MANTRCKHGACRASRGDSIICCIFVTENSTAVIAMLKAGAGGHTEEMRHKSIRNGEGNQEQSENASKQIDNPPKVQSMKAII